MFKVRKESITELLEKVTYLPDRTPEMAMEGGAENAFREVAKYRDGAIYTGYYSGNSEWERHPEGDETVMALEGTTTVVLRTEGEDQRVQLSPNDLVIVPRNIWHRFENSTQLKILTVTPQPTEHQIEDPEK